MGLLNRTRLYPVEPTSPTTIRLPDVEYFQKHGTKVTKLVELVLTLASDNPANPALPHVGAGARDFVQQVWPALRLRGAFKDEAVAMEVCYSSAKLGYALAVAEDLERRPQRPGAVDALSHNALFILGTNQPEEMPGEAQLFCNWSVEGGYLTARHPVWLGDMLNLVPQDFHSGF